MNTEWIKQKIKEAHKNAIEKGFYEKEKNIGELLMLIVSELGEALEAHRNGKLFFITGISDDKLISISSRTAEYEHFVKNTFEDEIADVFIRLFDLCGYLEIDITNYQEVKSKDVPDNVAESMLVLVDHVLNYRYSDSEDWANTMFHSLLCFSHRHNIPIEKHIKAKMAYNKTRPYKHGKEY